jgi:hypothetical protein
VAPQALAFHCRPLCRGAGLVGPGPTQRLAHALFFCASHCPACRKSKCRTECNPAMRVWERERRLLAGHPDLTWASGRGLQFPVPVGGAPSKIFPGKSNGQSNRIEGMVNFVIGKACLSQKLKPMSLKYQCVGHRSTLVIRIHRGFITLLKGGHDDLKERLRSCT